MDDLDKRETKRIKERERRREESRGFKELSSVIAVVARDTVRLQQQDPSSAFGLVQQRHREPQAPLSQIDIRDCLYQQDKSRIQIAYDAILLIRRLHEDNSHLRGQLHRHTTTTGPPVPLACKSGAFPAVLETPSARCDDSIIDDDDEALDPLPFTSENEFAVLVRPVSSTIEPLDRSSVRNCYNNEEAEHDQRKKPAFVACRSPNPPSSWTPPPFSPGSATTRDTSSSSSGRCDHHPSADFDDNVDQRGIPWYKR